MLKTTGGERSRQPALDGLRALAVAMVMAYHGGIAGLSRAGFFGVDIFFVLSGFLITGLLLAEEGSNRRIRFCAFWGRRARRLLPGLLSMLAVADLYVAYIAPAGRYPGFRGDALSVVAYVSNWHFIAASSNYFSATGVPSLLTHTWSLAIEEQFYLVWPVAVWALSRLARRHGGRPASLVLTVSAAGAIASAAWMAALYRSGTDPSRLYYGTDTHAASILVGAALAAAMVLRPDILRQLSPTPIVIAALAALLWAACTLGASDPVIYQGGFLLVAGLAAVVIAGLATRGGEAPARALSAAPAVYLGRISYGMYLWYFPLFDVLNGSTTGLTGPALFALRCAADVALAAASFRLVEAPLGRWRPSGPPVSAAAAPIALWAAGVAAVAGLILVDTPAAYSIGSSAGQPPIGTAAPVAAPGHRLVRVLVVGDSTAVTLGMGLGMPAVEQKYGILVDDRGLFGCGVAISASVEEHGQPSKPGAACNSTAPSSVQWPALLRADISQFHPDVVLLAAGRWEVDSRRATPSGPWQNITQPADAAYVRTELQLAESTVAAQGSVLALATAPCFSSGEQADGQPWPEDSPARVDAYNALVSQVVAAHPGRAETVDLGALVCPGGTFHTRLDGVTVRAPDGVHYPFFTISSAYVPDPDTIGQTQAFGMWVAPRLLEQLTVTG